ncbi:hypothetical protein ABIF65_003327 [Bradyrhizobium japonicum]
MHPVPDLAEKAPSSPHRETLAMDTISGRDPAPAQSPRMVNDAASRIYAAWQPHVGHDEAMHEARAFAARFHVLIDGPLAPLPDEAELDTTLAAVAAAMTFLDAAAQ